MDSVKCTRLEMHRADLLLVASQCVQAHATSGAPLSSIRRLAGVCTRPTIINRGDLHSRAQWKLSNVIGRLAFAVAKLRNSMSSVHHVANRTAMASDRSPHARATTGAVAGDCVVANNSQSTSGSTGDSVTKTHGHASVDRTVACTCRLAPTTLSSMRTSGPCVRLESKSRNTRAPCIFFARVRRTCATRPCGSPRTGTSAVRTRSSSHRLSHGCTSRAVGQTQLVCGFDSAASSMERCAARTCDASLLMSASSPAAPRSSKLPSARRHTWFKTSRATLRRRPPSWSTVATPLGSMLCNGYAKSCDILRLVQVTSVAVYGTDAGAPVKATRQTSASQN